MQMDTDKKVLSDRVHILEKELYVTIKELDHYRSKCKKLRLKLLSLQSKSEHPVAKNNSNEPISKPKQITPPSSPSKAKAKTKTDYEPDLSQAKPNLPKQKTQKTQKKTKKSLISEILQQDLPLKRESSSSPQPTIAKPKGDLEEGEIPISSKKNPESKDLKNCVKSASQVHQDPLPVIENLDFDVFKIISRGAELKPKAESQKISKKKPVPVYNSVYTIPPSISYNTFKSASSVLTPKTQSLSEISPFGVKIKESFNIVKNLYSSDYDFSYNNIYILAEDFKSLDPGTCSTFLVQQFVESIFTFSPGDALVLFYGICKELLKKSSWDLDFLKAIRNYFIRNTEDICFCGPKQRLPSMGIEVKTIQDILNTCFILICKENSYLILVSKMLAKITLQTHSKIVQRTFQILCESVKDCYSLRLYQRFVGQENIFKLTQEIVERSFTNEEYTQKNIYLACKCILRSITARECYEIYVKFFWPNLSEKKNSFIRILTLKIIPLVYFALHHEGKRGSCNDLRKKMEEILTDKDEFSNLYLGFSKAEQEVVSRGLAKMINI